MTMLNEFEINLLRVLQQPLPICERPFAKVAKLLETSERNVLETMTQLKDRGYIRRFRPHLNYRALGRIASLVCAHVPDEKFDKVADAVNALKGVSHNYCRAHHYNVWFTLQATSLIAVDVMLDGLREDFEVEFYSLPARRLFKLDVRFDPAGPGAVLDTQTASNASEIVLSDVPPVPVELSETEKQVLEVIQTELPICERPFEAMDDMPEGVDVIETLRKLSARGVLGKIAAVLDYPRLGYTVNVMFCAEVQAENVSEVGAALAQCAMVSHCYQRKTFAGWPFNLYGMCHAGNVGQIEAMAESFCITHNITHTQLLSTERELKKQPVKIVF